MAKKKRRKLGKSRYEESMKTRDEGGVSRKSYFDLKKHDGDAPSFYKAKEKLNKIIIVPYEVKSKNHPLVQAGKLKVGDLDYVLDVWVHKYVGASDADILCPKRTYGKPCPLCDIVKKMYDEADTDEEKKAAGDNKAKRRVLYNVLPVSKGEVAEDIKVFEVSHFSFEKEMIEEANACEDGSDIVPFADPEDGSVIKFRLEIDKSGVYATPKYKSFDFLEREEELEDDIIDQAVSFDECLILLTPDEIMALYTGDEEDEEEEAPKKSKSKAKKKVVEEDDDEEEEEEDDEEEETPPPKKKPARKKKKPEPEPEPEEEDEDEDEEEEEDDTPPPKKAKSKSKKATKKKVVEEDEDEEDDESAGGTCPKGHKFGTDCDKFKKDCNRCDLWEECMEASEEE